MNLSHNIIPYCIICYNKHGLKKITDKFVKKRNYLDGILKCFQVQFLDKHLGSDNLICTKCIAKLKYCYSFRKDIERAHQKLYKIVQINVTTDNNKNQQCYDEVNSDTYLQNSNLQSQDERLDLTYFETDANYYEDQKLADENDVTSEMEVEQYKSDWSADTDDILRATGYWEETERIKSKKRFLTPVLNEKSNKCPVCLKSFSLRATLLRHHSRHYPTHLCDICGNQYVSSTTFNHHAAMHQGASFICPVCKREFNNQPNMKSHYKRNHQGFKAFKCYVCKARFNSSKAKREHLVLEHNLEKEKLQCLYCDYLFLATTDLRQHLKETHFDKVEFKCVECSVVFLRRSEMKEHSVTHLGIKQHHCEFCGKDFARVHSLKEHLKIHLNIKKYVCCECDKAFVQKAALKSHIRVHYK